MTYYKRKKKPPKRVPNPELIGFIVYVPRELKERLDALKLPLGYGSRSELMRHLIMQFVEAQEC